MAVIMKNFKHEDTNPSHRTRARKLPSPSVGISTNISKLQHPPIPLCKSYLQNELPTPPSPLLTSYLFSLAQVFTSSNNNKKITSIRIYSSLPTCSHPALTSYLITLAQVFIETTSYNNNNC